MQLKHRCTKM